MHLAAGLTETGESVREAGEELVAIGEVNLTREQKRHERMIKRVKRRQEKEAVAIGRLAERLRPKRGRQPLLIPAAHAGPGTHHLALQRHFVPLVADAHPNKLVP